MAASFHFGRVKRQRFFVGRFASMASQLPFVLTLGIAGVGGAIPFALAAPGNAAERLYVTYNVLERSISVASLEAYAKQGTTTDEDLAAYVQYVNPNFLEELRTALNSKVDIKPVTVAQFLYSPQGEATLKRLAQVIYPRLVQPIGLKPAPGNGYKALRAALILAAAEPEGLTILTFLKNYPAQGIRIDVEQSLRIVAEVTQLLNQTQQTTQTIIKLAQLEAETDPPIGPDQPDLRQRGPFRFQKNSVTLTDASRPAVIPTPATPPVPGTEVAGGREYPVDVYIPSYGSMPRSGRIPVVVISHGLGSDRSSFAYLAEHLASYGFAVLVPQHPGSDSNQLEALLAGVASEVAEPTEFADRPLDISYLLDYFERQAVTDPVYQALNLKQVGVIGQSFGGYTALALAGAPINFQQLQKECVNVENTFNISLLLQCRASLLADAAQPRADFRDPRVRAVVAMNPIDSAVLGQTNLSLIQVPVLIITGSADTVAPSLFEQARPFTWLTVPDKYLVQMESGTHFSVIGGDGSGSGALPLPPEVIGPNPAIAQRYVNSLAVAFFQTYIANQPAYQSYLTARYAQFISDPVLRLDLVRTLTADQLPQAVASPTTTGQLNQP